MKYQVQVKLKAIVGMNVEAVDPEDALKVGRVKVAKASWFKPEFDYIDGREELVGVSGDWDID